VRRKDSWVFLKYIYFSHNMLWWVFFMMLLVSCTEGHSSWLHTIQCLYVQYTFCVLLLCADQATGLPQQSPPHNPCPLPCVSLSLPQYIFASILISFLTNSPILFTLFLLTPSFTDFTSLSAVTIALLHSNLPSSSTPSTTHVSYLIFTVFDAVILLVRPLLIFKWLHTQHSSFLSVL